MSGHVALPWCPAMVANEDARQVGVDAALDGAGPTDSRRDHACRRAQQRRTRHTFAEWVRKLDKSRQTALVAALGMQDMEETDGKRRSQELKPDMLAGQELKPDMAKSGLTPSGLSSCPGAQTGHRGVNTSKTGLDHVRFELLSRSSNRT